jgi:putative NADPH-quinone reductase
MGRRVLVINGHPDPSSERFAAALSSAYVRGASLAGHQIRRLDIGALAIPIIRRQAEFADAAPPPQVREAQEAIAWAEHIVIVFPLWLGAVPAALKAFLEQVFRYGFAVTRPGEPMRGLLKGRSARIVITMGMPAPVFWRVFGAHGLRCLEQGLLKLAGISPIRHTVLGAVEGPAARRAHWLEDMARLGAAAL